MDHDQKPKRPMNAYFKWRGENYQKIKNKNPDANSRDLKRLVAKAWEDFPEKERKQLEDEFRRENDKYNLHMEKWKKEHGSDGEENKSKERKKSSSHAGHDDESGKKKSKTSESGKKKMKEKGEKKAENAGDKKGNKKK